MTNPDRTRLVLDHIEQALDDIATLVQDLDEAGFRADRHRRLAVERCIEIISEASRSFPDDLKADHPDISWRAIAGIGASSVTTATTSSPTASGKPPPARSSRCGPPSPQCAKALAEHKSWRDNEPKAKKNVYFSKI